LDLEDLELKIDGRVKLVAATHTAAHRGYCAPIGLLSKATREVGAFFLLDSCQAIGQMPVDVKEIGCHALVGTGRKWLRAPRGTAFLYVAEELPFAVDPVTVDLAAADFVGDMQGPHSIDIRSDGKRFELWERSVAAAIGLGAAVDYLLQLDQADAFARIRSLAQYAVEAIEAGVPDAEVLYDAENPGGIVGVAFNGTRQPDSAQSSLAEAGINVSSMADYDAPWDYAAMDRSSVMRVAPHYFNEQADINHLVDCLAAGAR
jgi:cysteine desulfurase